MVTFNQQIDSILREYDQTRTDNIRIQDLRKKEVCSCVTGFEELDRHIMKASLDCLSLAFSGSPTEDLQKSIEEKVQQKQKLLEDAGFPPDYLDPVYTCRLCKDTGYVDNVRCDCFKKKLTDRLFESSNLKGRLSSDGFDKFDFSLYSDLVSDDKKTTPRANAKKAVEKALAFVHNFDGVHPSLLITGNTGVGKTFLCSCIAKELLKSGHSVIYLTEYELLDILKAHAFDKGSDAYDCVCGCDLLIIDDLGTAFNNALTVSEFYNLFNERLLRSISTLISSNLRLEEIRNNYSERVLSRLIGSYQFIDIYGDDIRKLKKLGGQSNGQAACNN